MGPAKHKANCNACLLTRRAPDSGTYWSRVAPGSQQGGRAPSARAGSTDSGGISRAHTQKQESRSAAKNELQDGRRWRPRPRRRARSAAKASTRMSRQRAQQGRGTTNHPAKPARG